MTLRLFAFTMPALGYQGTILPRCSGSPAADHLNAEVIVRGWIGAARLGFGVEGQLNAKGASTG
jgi:hypothetical protein